MGLPALPFRVVAVRVVVWAPTRAGFHPVAHRKPPARDLALAHPVNRR
jgi:hypothetical protein